MRRRCKPVVVVEETCSGKVVTWVGSEVGSGGDVVVSTLV